MCDSPARTHEPARYIPSLARLVVLFIRAKKVPTGDERVLPSGIRALLSSVSESEGREWFWRYRTHARGQQRVFQSFVRKEHSHVVTYRLIECGVNEEDVKWTVRFAATRGHLHVLVSLREAGVVFDGESALLGAAEGDRTEICEWLLDTAGVSVNCRGDFGQTPLHRACTWGHDGTVRLLVARGADVSAVNDDGRTPLALSKTVRVAEALVTRGGASVSEFDSVSTSDLVSRPVIYHWLCTAHGRAYEPEFGEQLLQRAREHPGEEGAARVAEWLVDEKGVSVSADSVGATWARLLSTTTYTGGV